MECFICLHPNIETNLIEKIDPTSSTSSKELTKSISSLLLQNSASTSLSSLGEAPEIELLLSSLCFKCVISILDAHRYFVELNTIKAKIRAVQLQLNQEFRKPVGEYSKDSNAERTRKRNLRLMRQKMLNGLTAKLVDNKTSRQIPLVSLVSLDRIPSKSKRVTDITYDEEDYNEDNQAEGSSENDCDPLYDDVDSQSPAHNFGDLIIVPAADINNDVGVNVTLESSASTETSPSKPSNTIKTSRTRASRTSGTGTSSSSPGKRGHAKIVTNHSDSDYPNKVEPDSDEDYDSEPVKKKIPKKIYSVAKDPLAKKIRCTTCTTPLYFKDDVLYQAHIKRKHQGIKKPYDCTICGKSFKYPIFLKEHQLIHTTTEEERQFPCTICPKIMKNRHSLHDHIKAHWETRFICEHCGKRCANRSHLESHLTAKHTKREEIYIHKCDIEGCTKIFNRAYLLQEHREFHNNPEKFTCEDCKIVFTRLSILKKHKNAKRCNKNKRKLKEEKPVIVKTKEPKGHTCSVQDCPEKFPTNQEVIEHRRTAHKGNEEAEKLNNLNKCDLCDKILASKNGLKDHMRIHSGVKSYKCRMCDCVFSTSDRRQGHQEMHYDRDRNFVCEICGAGFTSNAYLSGHKRNVHNKKKKELRSSVKRKKMGDDAEEIESTPSCSESEDEEIVEVKPQEIEIIEYVTVDCAE